MSRHLRHFYFGLVVALMCAPLAVTIGVSVNAKKVLFFPPRGFSLRWYEELFFKPAWLDALTNSLTIALMAGVIALSLALPIAYFLWRFKLRYAKALFSLGLMPFALPPVITAIGMLAFWAQLSSFVGVPLAGQTFNIVIGHGVFLMTLPLVMISLGLESIDKEVLEAAETMGADQKTTFWTVVLPLVAPYLFAGFAFVFVLSMNEFIISYFLGQSNALTLPVRIFSQLRSGYSPVIATAAVFFIVLALVVFSAVARFGDLPKLLGAWGGRQ